MPALSVCVVWCLLACGAWLLCAGQLKDAAAEIAQVTQSRQEAEQQINASKVKMDVLANYFKDKEKDLMRWVAYTVAVQQRHELREVGGADSCNFPTEDIMGAQNI